MEEQRVDSSDSSNLRISASSGCASSESSSWPTLELDLYLVRHGETTANAAKIRVSEAFMIC